MAVLFQQNSVILTKIDMLFQQKNVVRLTNMFVNITHYFYVIILFCCSNINTFVILTKVFCYFNRNIVKNIMLF